ncbi:transcriptional regulator [Kalymmatonema gypsitolerans NIES-4073]|nr:transcriptional regulator [Scytonema sp. NIES-4073]
MTITLTMKEESQLWAEAKHNNRQQPQREPFEIFQELPKELGKGYVRDVEVHPEFQLGIFDYEYHDDVKRENP